MLLERPGGRVVARPHGPEALRAREEGPAENEGPLLPLGARQKPLEAGHGLQKSIDVVPLLDTILKGGDCLLIKASLSVGMKVIADAISELEFSE